MAVGAADGFAVISDRKETYASMPPRNVKKYHMDKKGGFCISPEGDGRLAKGVLDGLGNARTGPADVVKRMRAIAAALSSRTRRRTARADGILIIAEHQGLKLCDIDMVDNHVDVPEDRSAVSIRGGGDAQGICRYVTRKVCFSGTGRMAAAMDLRVPASDVAEHVESVGERSCGFDPGMLAADGHAGVPERRTERFGRIAVRLHLAEPAPPIGGGGYGQ